MNESYLKTWKSEQKRMITALYIAYFRGCKINVVSRKRTGLYILHINNECVSEKDSWKAFFVTLEPEPKE